MQTPGRDPGKPCLSSSYRSSRTQSVHILVCPSIFKLSSCCLRAVFKHSKSIQSAYIYTVGAKNTLSCNKNNECCDDIWPCCDVVVHTRSHPKHPKNSAVNLSTNNQAFRFVTTINRHYNYSYVVINYQLCRKPVVDIYPKKHLEVDKI